MDISPAAAAIETTVPAPGLAGAAVASEAPAALPAVSPSLMALLLCTQIPASLIFSISVPLLAAMAGELAHDTTSAYLVKMVTGILGPAMVIGAPLAGWLADRVDRRPLLMIAGVIFVVMGLMPMVLTNLTLIVVARFFAGAAAAAIGTIGLTMVGTLFPEERRGGMLGLLGTVSLLTSIISIPIAGAVASTSWRAAFLLHLAVVPLVLLAAVRAMPPLPRHPQTATRAGAATPWYKNFPPALPILALAIGIVTNLPGIYVSFFFTSLGLSSTSSIGLVMMANAIIAAVFSFSYGKISRRLSVTGIFILCFAITGIGLALLAQAPNYQLAIAAQLFTGISMGMLVPNISAAAVSMVDEERRGSALGMAQGTNAISTLLGLTLLEPLAVTVGIQGIMMLLAGVAGLTFIALATGVLRIRPARPANA